MLTIVPIVHIDKVFSRYFSYIVLQNIPLYILFIFFLFQVASNIQRRQNRNSYFILLPVLLFSIHSIILSCIGYLRNYNTELIVNELYQNFYYFFAVPLFFLLKKRISYVFVIRTILLVFIIISVEYIVIYLLYGGRSVTYHMVFLPFPLAYFLTKLLFRQNELHSKITLVISILIIIFSLCTSNKHYR